MFHVKHEAWARWLGDLTIDPARLELFTSYEDLLRNRAIPAGMIAADDVGRLAERHIGDALRAAGPAAGARRVVDLGSGAGLPGIPLAIAMPSSSFVLVERRRSRAAFLESVVDRLQLGNVRVHVGRAEDVAETFDTALARAFARPDRTWETAEPLLAEGGRLLYWAGEGFDPARDAPPGVRTELFRSVTLANAGPVVIMTRQ